MEHKIIQSKTLPNFIILRKKDLDNKINQSIWLKSKAEKINDRDFEKVTEKADDIKDKFEKEGPLNRFIEDGKLLISIVKDYWSGKFKEISEYTNNNFKEIKQQDWDGPN